VACLRGKPYAEAGKHLRLALDLYDELGDHVGAARTVLNLGILAEQQSDFPAALDNIGWYQEAIRCFDQALELWRDAGERFFEAAILDDPAHPDAGPVRARLRDDRRPVTQR
jgi:tetratricopeptide (TPR) repeat protein